MTPARKTLPWPEGESSRTNKAQNSHPPEQARAEVIGTNDYPPTGLPKPNPGIQTDNKGP